MKLVKVSYLSSGAPQQKASPFRYYDHPVSIHQQKIERNLQFIKKHVFSFDRFFSSSLKTERTWIFLHDFLRHFILIPEISPPYSYQYWVETTPKMNNSLLLSPNFSFCFNLPSRRVSRADGGGGGPYVLRQAIASRLKPRAETGPPPEPRGLGWRIARFWLADDSGYVILEFYWLPTLMY